MDKKDHSTSKKIVVCIIAFFLAIAVVCAFLFVNSIQLCLQFDPSRLTFKEETLTFEKVEQHHNRGGYYYSIYFQEYEDSFCIDTVISKAINKEALKNLGKGYTVRVTFCEEFQDICSIRCNGNTILDVSGYIRANRNNQIIGIVFCPFFIFCALFAAWFFFRGWRPIRANNGLGRIRIEHTVNGNVVRIYHSTHVCSLVINDQIVDQHHGFGSNHYCLKGIIGSTKISQSPLRIQAKMGTFHMRLYCNDQLVAKRFMLFG